MITPTDIIVILIIAAIVGAICLYLYRQKKNGAKCIGCPHSKSCSGNCDCNNEKKTK